MTPEQAMRETLRAHIRALLLTLSVRVAEDFDPIRLMATLERRTTQAIQQTRAAGVAAVDRQDKP